MQPSAFPRRVLVAVTGLSPQVVTETLYALINAHATLADIPFVSLRHGLPESLLRSAATFSEAVAAAAENLGPDEVLSQTSQAEQALTLLTPVKKAKGQATLEAADQWLSTAVCRVRQPIESLFNWLEEKTGIQCASKVRSCRGLLVHVFGRLAAAFWLLTEAKRA
jgi:hypothetical protein